MTRNSAKGIWGSRFERSFYDINIFNPYAPTNRIEDTKDSYFLHEKLKRLKYQDRIVDTEHWFSPLILATTGGASPVRHKLISCIASFIAQKQKSKRYPEVDYFICTRASVSLLTSTILCMRRCRSHKSKKPTDIHIETFNGGGRS